MALPASQNFTLYRGDDFARNLYWFSKDTAGIKSPLNLTGCVPKAELRDSEAATTVIATIGFDTTQLAAGIIKMTLSRTVTATMPATCKYDLQLTHPDGTVRTYLAGTFTASGEITKP